MLPTRRVVSEPVVVPATFSAVVIMVIITTLINAVCTEVVFGSKPKEKKK
jgi:hypothetical protein